MALKDFFNHTCNIFHLKSNDIDLGYNITDKKYSYDVTPDVNDIPCHFYIKTPEQFIHNDPQPSATGRIKLVLPIGTDIRTNDKVINNVTGLEYITEIVHNIREHHLMVYLFRDDEDQIPQGGVSHG